MSTIRGMAMRLALLLLTFSIGGCGSKTAGSGERWSHTREQKRTRGFWEVTAGAPGVSWIAISPGTSENRMKLVWPTGLGCKSEIATILDNTITVVGEGFPAIVIIESSKTARLSFRFANETRLAAWLVKTRSDPTVICE